MSRIIAWGVGGILLSIFITYIPTIIAFVKKNVNNKQLLVYQSVIVVINLVICILLNLLPGLFIFRIVRNAWDVIFGLTWIYMLICALINKYLPRP